MGGMEEGDEKRGGSDWEETGRQSQGSQVITTADLANVQR